MISVALIPTSILLLVRFNFKIKLISPATITYIMLVLYFVIFTVVEDLYGNTVKSIQADFYVVLCLFAFSLGIFAIRIPKSFEIRVYKLRKVSKLIFVTLPIFNLFFMLSIIGFLPITLSDVLSNPKLFRYAASNGGFGPVYTVFGILTNWTYLYLIIATVRQEIKFGYVIYYLPFFLFFGYISASSGFVLNLIVIPLFVFVILRRQVKILWVGITGTMLVTLYFISRLIKGGSLELSDFQNIIRKIFSRFDSYELFIMYLNSSFSKQSPTFQAIIDFPFFYIPRSMMESKPYFFQVEATQLVIFDDPTFTDVTYSFTGIAEALHSFGLLGVILLGFMSGILLILISNWFSRGRYDLKYLTIYYWTFGSLSYSLLTDKIVADLFNLPITVVVAYFWFKIFYYREKSSCIYP